MSKINCRMFEGHLSEEEEVLQWLITQKTEDRIELITRQMLETMVEDTQYLAVYFCKSIAHSFRAFFLSQSFVYFLLQSSRVFSFPDNKFFLLNSFHPELEKCDEY